MILVTGGTGFIGSNLVAALADRGADVVVCDTLDSDEKRHNIAKHKIADLIEPDALDDWLACNAASVSVIFHLGAISSTVETDVDLIMRNNFRLSLDLWKLCVANGVRLIYASSAATYGDGELGFDDDNASGAMLPLRPLNPYGWSKLLFDRKVAHMIEHGEPVPSQWAGLRFFNVYGPNEHHKGGQRSVVPQFWQQIKRDGRARLFKSDNPDYADGGQLRDFVYVGDCVDVMLWLLDNPGASGIFNLGTGKARSFDDMAKAIFAALGQTPEIEYIDMPGNVRGQYQYYTQARMDRLRDAGYDRPFTSLEDGVRTYVQDYLETNDPYR